MLTPTEFLENLDFEKFESILTEHTIVNPDNWRQELIEGPSTYTYLAAVMETAKKELDANKAAVELASSMFKRERREKEGKISESKLNSEVALDTNYKLSQQYMRQAEEKYGWMKSIVCGMR